MAPQTENKLKRKNFTSEKVKTSKKPSQNDENSINNISVELKEEILSKLSAILTNVQEIVRLL